MFVAGYPAHTEQFATPMEIDELVSWAMPRQIRYCQDNVTVIEKAVEGDAAATHQGYPPIRGLNNRKKALQGSLDGLGRGGVALQKSQQYATFAAWLKKRDPAQLELLEDFKKALDQRAKTRARRANFDEILQASSMLQSAIQIVRWAKEGTKPDAERKPAFQERNLPMIRAGLEALDQRYAQKNRRGAVDAGAGSRRGRAPGRSPRGARDVGRRGGATQGAAEERDQLVRG